MGITKDLIIATIVILAAVDVWLYITKGSEATISRTLLKWSQAYPIIAFALGVVFGHIFWSNA